MTDLRAGVAELDITPWLDIGLAGHFEARQAQDIDDPLRAKALVLDDGNTPLALVVLDLISLPRADVQAIRTLIAEHTRIPADQVMIACTHTHTAPMVRDSRDLRRDEAFVTWLIRRVADTVRLAEKRLQPALLATGAGACHGLSFCRRFRMRDGTVMMNPGRNNPQIVEPTSPIDPTVGVLYVETPDHQPLAVLAQFSLHYVGTDNPLHLSADYYGHFATAMRERLGPTCVPMLMNGTSGQINNIDVSDPHQTRGHAQARRVAQAVATEVHRVIHTLTPQPASHLAATTERITLPRKQVTAEDVMLAERLLAGEPLPTEAGPWSFVVGQPIPERLERLYAHSCAPLHALRDQPIASEVQTFRVGDSAWVALPGEVFVEIGLAIKADSPLAQTFVIGLANDSLGYLCTDHAYQHEGGYETWASIGNAVGAGAEGVLRDAANRSLQRLT